MKLSIPRFDKTIVLVVGDVMLDRYWHGSTQRISPEAPVPVIKVNKQEDRPGGAANVALNIAALGAAARVAAVVGDDEAAAALRTRLSAAEIATHFYTSDKPTITKLRAISRQQQLIRMDFEEMFTDADADGCTAVALKQVDGASALVISDYQKGTLGNLSALIAKARQQQIPILVDPKGTDFSRYQGSTLLTPNLQEFEAVVGECVSESDIVRKGQALIKKLNLQALLITRSEKGMTLLQQGESEKHLPARAREVFDVTGAGDTVIAVLAAAVGAGAPLDEAVALANLAAGIVVGKLGTATVSAPELRRAVSVETGSEKGVVSLDQLLMALTDAREQNERIVFTNGCFDIIHAGHVGYLEEAKKLGDRLVVALNSDASVSKLKGPGRPINPLESRMAVLAGLESVDWVLGFDEDTPENLLRAIQPEILVKGGDYSDDQVVGWEIVKGYGGEVKALSLYENHSTTSIVEKIKTSK